MRRSAPRYSRLQKRSECGGCSHHTRAVCARILQEVEEAFLAHPQYEELHKGTLEYIRFLRCFMRAFMSTTTFLQRIEDAAYAVYFVRIWRGWLASSAATDMGLDSVINGPTVQFAMDVEIACHSLVSYLAWVAQRGNFDIAPDRMVR